MDSYALVREDTYQRIMATMTLDTTRGLIPQPSWIAGVQAIGTGATRIWGLLGAGSTTAEEGEQEDAAWIQRISEGDQAAAEAMVRRLYPTVMRMVRSHLPRRTQEEDLAQQVFAKIFQKLHQFSGRVPLEHWVTRIAINTCINQLKHEISRPELRMSDLSEDEEAVVKDLAQTDHDVPGDRVQAARELLDRLMMRLRPDERTVITLLHIEERSTEEISQMTGWPVSLVKVKAFRARNKMRHLWDILVKRQEAAA